MDFSLLSQKASTYSKPKVHANRKSEGWVHVFNTLTNKSAMDWLVRCHFANGGILGVNNDASTIALARKDSETAITHAVREYVNAVPAGPAKHN